MHPSLRQFTCVIIAAQFLVAPETRAATATWTPGSGAWNNGANWNTSVVPGTTPTGDIANFSIGVGPGKVVTLDNGAGTAFSPILSNLTVTTGGGATAGLTINGGAGGVLTMTSGATMQWGTGSGTGTTNVVGAGILLKGALNLNLSGSAAAPLIINGAITDAGANAGVTISGTGSTTYQGANTYTGATTVSSSTLNLNRTGGTSLAGNLVVSGGTVNLQQSNQIATGNSVSVSSGSFNIGASSNTVFGVQITGGSITGNTSGTIGALTSATNVDAQNGSISARLAGTAGLNKTTAGTVTLTNNNTYTGLTTVSAGTLALNSLAGNAVSGNVTVAGGTLQLSQSNQIADTKNVTVSGGTFAIGANSETVNSLQLTAGAITGNTSGTVGVLTSATTVDAQNGTISARLGGTAGLNKTNTGTVTLNNANTFTGLTTVSAGTLNLNSTVGPAIAGNLTVSGGTAAVLQNNQIATTSSVTVSGGTLDLATRSNTVSAVHLTGNGSIIGTSGTLTSTTAFDLQGGTASAILAGSVGANKTTTGSVTLSGANTFTGTTTASAGTLNLNSSSGPALAGNLAVNGATVSLKQSNQIAPSKTITVSSGTLDLTTFNNTVSNLKVTGGTVQSTSGAITAATPYDVQGGTISAKLAGSVGLNKTGGTTATLSGANTFTGDTVVSAGTLNLSSASGPAIPGHTSVTGGSVVLQRSNQFNAAKTVAISGGTLAIGTNSTTVAGLSITSGQITGSTGVLTSATDYNVQGGTISARLGGAVGLNKTGSGTVTLSGLNSFSGDTSVNSGTLNLGATSGSAIQGNLNVNTGGTATLQQNQQLPARANINVNGGTLATGSTTTTVNQLHLTQNGQITGTTGGITSSNSFDLQSGTVGAVLSGSVGASVTGGSVTYTNKQIYTGATQVSSNGSLNLNAATGPAIAGDLTISATGTVNLQQHNQTAPTKSVMIDGGTLDTKTFNTSVSGITLNSGTISGSGVITSDAGFFDFKSGTVNAALAGSSRLLVSTGKVTLNGANTYTGYTKIESGGTLVLNGSTAAGSPLYLGSQGTLAGKGTVGGTVQLTGGGIIAMENGTINGALDAGQGSITGSITVNGKVTSYEETLSIASGAQLNAVAGVNVNGTLAVAGDVNGKVTINSGGQLALTGAGKISDIVSIGKGGSSIVGTGSIGGLDLQSQSNLQLGNGATITLTKGTLTSTGNASISGGTLAAGAAGFTVNTPGTLTIGSNLTATGGLIKTGAGVLNLQGTSTFGGASQLQQGTITLDGTLNTSQLVLFAGTTFNGSGTLNGGLVNNGGIFNPGHSPGTLRIGGNFRQTPNGTLVLQVQDNNIYDRVIASGTVHLAGTLDVQNWSGHQFNYGDKVPNFIQAGRINGHFDSVIMPTSNLRGRLINDGQNLTLLAAPASYTLVAQTPNQVQVAKALDRWIGKESGDVGVVTLALDELRAEQYPGAFNSIGPAYYSVLPQVGIEVAAGQNSMLQQRLAEIRSQPKRAPIGTQHATMTVKATPAPKSPAAVAASKPKSGKPLEEASPAVFATQDEPWTSWIQTGGQFAQIQTLQTLGDNHFDGLTAIAGLDHRLGAESAAGIAVGYNYSHLNFDHGDRTITDAGRISLYGVAGLGHGYFLDGAVTGGYTNYDVKRPIVFGTLDRLARGRTDGSELSAAVQFGKDFHLGKWTVTPKAGFQYTRVHLNGLNETNAGALNLALNGYGAQSMRGTLGAMVSYEAKLSEKVNLTPYLTASWQHEFDSPTETVRAALPADGGGSFRYNSGTIGDDRMQAGAGLIFSVGDNTTLNLGYQAEFGSSDYESHMIMLMMSYRF